MPTKTPRPILSAAIHVNDRSTFTAGFNNIGNNEHELLEIMPGGKIRVLLVGISRAKAEALALVLNAPEGTER